MSSATPAPEGRELVKLRASASDAIAGLRDGARVMVGGFGLCGNAEALISAVVDSGVRDLTLISNNAGNLGKGLAECGDNQRGCGSQNSGQQEA